MEWGKICENERLVNAEVSILGLIICNPKSMYFFVEHIRPKDFIDKRHKIIYKAIQYLFFQQAPIDVISICEALKASNRLDECGGALYISEIMMSFESSIDYICKSARCSRKDKK